MMSSPREISESCWAAERRGDLDAVMGHFHADATYRAPDGPRAGLDAIRGMYEYYAKDFPELVSLEILREFPDGDTAAIEFDAVVTDPEGMRYRVRGVNLVQVRDGKFVSVRSYEDQPVADHA
jgi:ketosteroid isomerase-like protein